MTRFVLVLLVLLPPAASARRRAPPQEVPSAEKADTAWLAGDTDRAFDLYRRRLAAFPTEERTLHRLALLYAWREDYDHSLELFDHLLELDPLNREARVDRTRVLAWQGDARGALAALDRILDEDPTYRPALEARARFLSWGGEFEESLSTYDRLLALAPGDPTVRTARAAALTMASRYEASEAVYDSILTRDPGDIEARLGRARVMTYTDRLDQARDEYGEVLRQDPGNLEAMQGRARALTWDGRSRAGEEAWREALAADPDNTATLVGLAQTLRWQGRNGAAMEVLQRARRSAPTNGDVREQLRWVEAILSPRLAPSLVLEEDSDHNRMLTTNVQASWYPAPRFGLRADAYQRDLEQRALERRALGLHLTGNLELGPGWRLSAGVGGSENDRDVGQGEDDQVVSWSGALETPGRYPWVLRMAASRSALDATALMAERGVVKDEATVSTRWTSPGGWRLDASLGRAWMEGTASNRRNQASLGLSKRLGQSWNVGARGRAFGYRRDLTDGYFDPDFYGIAELVGLFQWEPAHWSVRLEAAPGVQQVTTDGDPAGAFRASARLAWRLRPGRELSVSGGYSSTGLQSFSTGASDYRYTAVVVGASWVF
ncbi:MAG TPA: tetratricopeptide repeat protein [Longimicrobiales bacterium]|nr:tetratricopeptide repeat protein [Longimicrobiales bacterium]